MAHNTPSARPQPSEALNSLYLSPPGNGGTFFGLRKVSYYGVQPRGILTQYESLRALVKYPE